MMTRKNGGFTLMETMLSVAIGVIIFGIAAPVSLSMLRKNDLDGAVHYTVSAVRRSQSLARSGSLDSAWGVKLTNSQVVLFKGSSYLGRDVGFDEITSISSRIVVSGIDEITFSKLNGVPSVTGAIIMTNDEGTVSSITINSHGTLNY
jgi:prepilin-type N-terminal cleavage/methylation domain-containing protein